MSYMTVDKNLHVEIVDIVNQARTGSAYRNELAIFDIRSGMYGMVLVYKMVNIRKIGEGIRTKYLFDWEEVE